MKKKVKKIPKYSNGTPYSTAEIDAIANQMKLQMGLLGTSGGQSSTVWKNMDTNQKISTGIETLGAAGSLLNTAMSGQDVTVGGAISATALGAAAGAKFGGPIGAIGGALFGLAAGTSGRKRGYDPETGTADMGSGWMKMFGPSKDYVLYAANMAQNSIQSRQQTENLRADYYNENPTGNINIEAAEGGIMRRPVNALVSPGEIAIDPITLQYEQFGNGNEEPNSKDNISTVLETGYIVRSHAKHMIMPNGKTSAENSKMVLDSNAPEEMKRVMIKKIGNWESAHRTKSQLYAMYGDGTNGVKKYGYNKNMSEFAYWDKDKNEYKKEYLDWVNNLTEQDVKDIFNGKYGDMSTYKGVNAKYIPTVEEARKLMTDKKYGDWHKIGESFVNSKLNIKNPNETALERTPNTIDITGLENGMLLNIYSENSPILYNVNKINQPLLKGVANPSAAAGSKAARKQLNAQNRREWLNNIFGLLPVVGGLFDKYDWHKEEAQISPAKYVPVNANIDPLRRAADESFAMARYNQANLSTNTGAGMAYGLQAASNRAKQYADAYQWQQETNNKLIAQNAGIYNDWRKQRDAYVTQAIADTRANEAAADAQRDTRIKDAMSYYRDWQLTPFLKQYLSSGAYDKSIKRLG